MMMMMMMMMIKTHTIIMDQLLIIVKSAMLMLIKKQQCEADIVKRVPTDWLIKKKLRPVNVAIGFYSCQKSWTLLIKKKDTCVYQKK